MRGRISLPSMWMMWQFSADDGRDGGQQIYGARQSIALGSGWDLVGPSHDGRDSHATFPTGPLPFSKWSSVYLHGPIAQPWAIIAGEDDERILVEFQFLQVSRIRPTLQSTSATTSAKSPVQFCLETIRRQTKGRGPSNAEDRERRVVFVLSYELDRLFGIPFGQLRLIIARDLGVDDGVVFDQG